MSIPTPTFDPVRYGKIARDIAIRRGFHRLAGRAFDLDDLEQAALLELLERLPRYHPSVPFEAWARTALTGGMASFVQNNTRTVRVPAGAQSAAALEVADAPAVHSPQHERSFDAPANEDGLSLHDLIGESSNELEAAEGRVALQQALALLAPAQSLVIRELLSGQTQQELAERLGVTRQRVQQVKTEALEKLRGLLD